MAKEKKGRKVGRNAAKCGNYRLMGTRERNKARRQAARERRLARAKANREVREAEAAAARERARQFEDFWGFAP